MNLEYLIQNTFIICKGLKYTLLLFTITLLFSLPLGVVLMYLRKSKYVILSSIVGVYVWVLRGTPLLMQLFFFCYGITFIPGIGKFLVTDRFIVACITFVLNYSAYFCEIFRGGILSVDKGQYEAAEIIGLSKFQTNIHIVFPQILKVVLPSITNESINLIKDTALITAIGITELLYFAKAMVNREVNPTAFIIVAAIYLFMTYGLGYLFKKLEKKFLF